MSVFLGIDTSNYTTSVALYDNKSNEIISEKKLLPVDAGEVGLMQSKALFNHIRQLPDVMEAAFSSFNKKINISAAGVSSRPRDVEGSYMPVFLAGLATAKCIATSSKIPCFEFSHQAGHILSALWSANRLDLINTEFIAFHVSGGTTEALFVTPCSENIIKCEIIAKTLDLNAGQAIDRIGNMLSLQFPCGMELDKLSVKGKITTKIKPKLIGLDCCLSGLENQCQRLFSNNIPKEDIARYAIEYIYEVINLMTIKIKDKYGDLPIIYSGGVMSNSIISKRISALHGGMFASPKFSSDNAAGIAILTSIKQGEMQ